MMKEFCYSKDIQKICTCAQTIRTERKTSRQSYEDNVTTVLHSLEKSINQILKRHRASASEAKDAPPKRWADPFVPSWPATHTPLRIAVNSFL